METRDAEARELLDEAAHDAAVLRRNLRDIRHINMVLGWTRLTVRAVARHVRERGLRSFSLLDVASGSADMPLAVAHWATRAGIQARIVATDINPQIVAVARERAAGTAGITVERQDALTLPYPPGSFDIALCTLALHHFAPEEAVTLLRHLARVGRHLLVFDLVRSPLAYLGVRLLTRVTRMHPMTQHHAAVSVRRGYTAAEARALVARAGLGDATVRVGIPYRLIIAASGAR
ncbi:MAG: methyltransferase domain-containing protein [Ktedonobacterales bacterium]|nr:methyltransferase domain-containing protein [Ktedonobacterales bacterium]